MSVSYICHCYDIISTEPWNPTKKTDGSDVTRQQHGHELFIT